MVAEECGKIRGKLELVINTFSLRLLNHVKHRQKGFDRVT